jgi:hypothetical protein
MDKQKKLDEFFGIKHDSLGSNSTNSLRAPTEPRVNLLKAPSPSRSPTNQYNQKKPEPLKSSFLPEDSCTYALPHFIPRVWSIVKPKLIELKNGKVVESKQFYEIIQSFIQSHYKNPLKSNNVSGLEKLIESLASSQEVGFFFSKMLPLLADLALQVETLFKEPLRILKQNSSTSVTLTKKQVACLLTHMFFCTLHK